MVQPVSWWKGLADSYRTYDWSTYFYPWANSYNSYYYYFERHPLLAFRDLWLATGDTTYLDLALQLPETMIAHARLSSSMSTSQYKDGYYGWLSVGDGNLEAVLRETCGWVGVTSVLRKMRAAGIHTSPTWSARYDAILAFTEEHIWEKWWTRGVNNIYRYNNNMTSHWGAICADLSVITARGSTQAAVYQTIAHAIISAGIPATPNNWGYGTSLINEMYAHPLDAAAWAWTFDWNKSGVAMDHGHGNHTAQALITGYEVGGLGVTEAHLVKLAKTVLANWNESTTSPAYTLNVDGSGGYNANINQIFDFVALGAYHEPLQLVFEYGPEYQNYKTNWYGRGAWGAYQLIEGGGSEALDSETVAVAASGDDANDDYATGLVNAGLTYGLVWPNTNPASLNYLCSGLRFRLNAAKDATFLEAHLSLFVSALDDANLTIYAHKVANAPDFNATADIVGRARTTASVAWVAANLTGGGNPAAYVNSPDLSAILNEIVAQADWEPGNYVALLLIAAVADTGTNRLAFGSWDHESEPPPQLVWSTGSLPVTVTPEVIPLGSLSVGTPGYWFGGGDVSIAGVGIDAVVMDGSILDAFVYPAAQQPADGQVMTVALSVAQVHTISIVETDLDV